MTTLNKDRRSWTWRFNGPFLKKKTMPWWLRWTLNMSLPVSFRKFGNVPGCSTLKSMVCFALQDHKPNAPREKQRIEAAGGWVENSGPGTQGRKMSEMHWHWIRLDSRSHDNEIFQDTLHTGRHRKIEPGFDRTAKFPKSVFDLWSANRPLESHF